MRAREIQRLTKQIKGLGKSADFSTVHKSEADLEYLRTSHAKCSMISAIELRCTDTKTAIAEIAKARLGCCM